MKIWKNISKTMGHDHTDSKPISYTWAQFTNNWLSSCILWLLWLNETIFICLLFFCCCSCFVSDASVIRILKTTKLPKLKIYTHTHTATQHYSFDQINPLLDVIQAYIQPTIGTWYLNQTIMFFYILFKDCFVIYLNKQ